MQAAEQPLLARGFEFRNRPYRDVFWTFLYAAVMLLTASGGVVAFLHRNPRYAQKLTPEYLSDAAHCPVHAHDAALLAAAEAADDSPPFDLSEFLHTAKWWMVGSAGLSVAVALLWLWLWRVAARGMVMAAVNLQIALPICAGIAMMFTRGSNAGAAASLIMMGLFTALLFCCWWRELELCARLLEVSAKGLHDNGGIIVAVIVLQTLLLVMMLAVLCCAGLAGMNGHVVPNGARNGTLPDKQGHCFDDKGEQVFCCSWQVDDWVPAYWTLCGFVCVWTALLFGQIRNFVIAASIAQWYFAEPGVVYKNTVGRAMRHAFGPSFGSLCFASLVLTAVHYVRAAAERARQDARGNIISWLASCVLDCIASIVEFITKFATIQMAITGESFRQASAAVTQLLTRNLLPAVGVWWIPPMVLQCCALMMSVVWGMVVYTSSHVAWRHLGTQGTQQAVVLAVLAGVFAFILLSFFGGVLISIVDAVFVCFAMDRDEHTVTNEHVHQVYSSLPTIGVGVQQPDGGIAYGAPEQPTHGLQPPDLPPAPQSYNARVRPAPASRLPIV